MLGKEHNPPHVHVIYGEYIAAISIETLEIIEGELPQRAQKLVQEWIKIHKYEILDIWNNQTFRKITPLN